MMSAFAGLAPSSIRLPPSGQSFSKTATANARISVTLPAFNLGSVVSPMLTVVPFADSGLSDPLLSFRCIDWAYFYSPSLSTQLQYKIEVVSGDATNYGSYVLNTWTAFTGASVEVGYQVNSGAGAAMTRSGTLRISLRFGTSAQVISFDVTLTATRTS